MSQPSPPDESPIVFISYAHESSALRAAVKSLADWLAARDCAVITDHPHIDRPPAEGWQAWMLDCIERADTVLIVCTPKLKARYEKTANPDTGRGATYEGAIVTQRIYDAAMRNTKFFPIVPDGGSDGDVPTFLSPWSNGHRFTSGNEGIRRLIYSGPTRVDGVEGNSSDTATAEESTPTPRSDQERLAIRLLNAPAAAPFLKSLRDDFASTSNGPSIPPTSEAIVQRFAEFPASRS